MLSFYNFFNILILSINEVFTIWIDQTKQLLNNFEP